MGRIRVPLMIVAAICLVAAAAVADIGKGGGDRAMLAEPDPNSTLEIGDLSGQLPLTNIDVPVYLHTTSMVGYIQCYIVFDTDEFIITDVTMESWLPGTAELETTWIDHDTVGTDILKVVVKDETAEFSVPTNTPFVKLQADVECFGYGQSADISFDSDPDHNYYNHNNTSYSPLREEGTIALVTDYHAIYRIGTADALAGEQDIPLTISYFQFVPGKPFYIQIGYDTLAMSFDTATSLDTVNGPWVYSSADTGVVTIAWMNNSEVSTGQWLDVCEVTFDMITGNDGRMLWMYGLAGGYRTACGDIEDAGNVQNGMITIPLYTASADIKDATYYDSADTFSVAITIDGSMPVDSFHFEVNFPDSELGWVGTAPSGGYPTPWASTNFQQYPGFVKFDADTGFAMALEDLPEIAFYMRFVPLSSPTVGDEWDITFTQTGNDIWFDRDGGFGLLAADLTTYDGGIEIVPDPPPSCPALHVWNGETYSLENTILPQCDGRHVETDVTDWYLLNKPIVAADGKLRCQIREEGLEVSRFSGFRLLAIDHPVDEPIRVTRDGEILTLGRLFEIKEARDHRGEDIRHLLAAEDDVYYDSQENGWFEVSFGTLSAAQIRNFVTIDNPKPKEPKALTASDDKPDSKLRISVKIDDAWVLVSEADARAEKTLQSTLVREELLSSERELVLRYSWEGWYRTDMVEFREAEEWQGVPVEPALLRAERTAPAGAEAPLAVESGVLTLARGETIDLAFDASKLVPIKSDVKRDWIFVSTGRYSRPGADEETPRGVFALDANVPNPFNPTTTIRFNLPVTSHVDVRVYDVRGALVRTLVAGVRQAGEQSVVWNGTNDAGSRMASGVYFCRMTAPGFERTRKLILLR